MGKSLFEDMVEFLEKGCEKLSLYSGLYSFYLVLLFLLLLLNCIPYGTELPQNGQLSRTTAKSQMELFVIKVNGFQLAVLDLLQLSCLFSSTIKFSKSSGILVYLLNNHNETYDVYILRRICITPFLKNSSGWGGGAIASYAPSLQSR